MPRSRALGCAIWRVWAAPAHRMPAEPAATGRPLPAPGRHRRCQHRRRPVAEPQSSQLAPRGGRSHGINHLPNLATGATGAAQHDVVAGDGVAAALLDVAHDAFETLVGERVDLAAVVADDVVVMVFSVPDGFEARDAVPEIEALDEMLLGEHVEHAVHACEADRLAELPELPVDLLGADTAMLTVEKVDHPRAGETAPVAGRSELGEGTLRPRRVRLAHTKMVTVLDTVGENHYRLRSNENRSRVADRCARRGRLRRIRGRERE